MFLFPLILFVTNSYGQVYFHTDSATQENAGEVQTLFRNEMSFGLEVHSSGFGVNFRRGRHITGSKKLIYEIGAVNIRHPKEYKVFNPSYDSKGFIYGKLNNFYIIRPGIGFQKILISKLGEGKVEIRFIGLTGLSLGLLKPVYLEIIRHDSVNTKVTEQFNPSKHSINDIYGKAPFSQGLENLTIVPGGFAKAGLCFEYSDTQEGIKAIEIGATLDIFPKQIPIMAKLDNVSYNPNKNYFLNLYLAFLFGEKWF